jgi:hypothetical protein
MQQIKTDKQYGDLVSAWKRGSFLGRIEILLRIVTTDAGFFNIFYCHHPGFCAIKGNLQPQVDSGFENNSQSALLQGKNNLKGGWASGYPFSEFRAHH